MVDYVTDYGLENSRLTQEGVDKFREWRPEYAAATFASATGTYVDGKFNPADGATAFKMITASEVGKMSKSKYNVINPDDVVDRYGADCFRMYEMFLGPIEQSKPWDTKGIDGVSKFLRKFWNLFYQDGTFSVSEEVPTKAELKILHSAIKKVTDDIERLSFNTCVAAFMVATNDLSKIKCNKKAILQEMVLLLAPFAVHITEELWRMLGNEDSVHKASYPAFNEEYLKEDEIEYPISINGKKRATAVFPANASKEDIEKAAVEIEGIQRWIEGKTIRKIIVVPKRMVNIVVG